MAVGLLWGHVLVDWSHIVLVIAWSLVLLKQCPRFYALFTDNRRTIDALFR
jgi:hypothetical protein